MAAQSDAELLALVQATSDFTMCVSKLMRDEVASRAAATTEASLDPNREFLQPASRLGELLERCVDIGEASVRIARKSIKLFSAFKNGEMTVETNIANDVDSILEAIEDARTACSEFRLADAEAERVLTEFPWNTVEKLRSSSEGSKNLNLLLSYNASRNERCALPIEQRIGELENWWRSVSANTLRGVISSTATAVLDQIISANKEHINYVCVYVHPFEKCVGLASNPTLHLEFQDFSPETAFGLDTEEVQHQIEELSGLAYCGLNGDTLRLVLQDDILRFIHRYTETGSAKSIMDEQDRKLTVIASSYAKMLNHIYDSLASFVEVKIHFYNIYTKTTAILLQDFSKTIQPILDLKTNVLGILEEVKHEIKLTQEAFATTPDAPTGGDDTSDPLELKKNLLHTLLDHLRGLSDGIFTSNWTYTDAVPPDELEQSFVELVECIFSESTWNATLKDLAIFEQQMSRLQSTRPGETQRIWERHHSLSGPPYPFQLEELYKTLPSLRAFIPLHLDIIHLPHYGLLLQRQSGVVGGRVATTVMWPISTAPSRYVGGRQSLFGLAGGVRGSELVYHWKPRTHKEQLQMVSEGHVVKRAWATAPPSSRASFAQQLEQNHGGTGFWGRKTRSSQIATGASRSLQGDWSF